LELGLRSASDFLVCNNSNNSNNSSNSNNNNNGNDSNLAADRAVLAVLTSWLARTSFGRASLKKAVRGKTSV
jgi:hypothetical protein